MLLFRLNTRVLFSAVCCLFLATGGFAETVVTCENGSVHDLGCRNNEVISVQSALYGRADSVTCSEGRPANQLSNTMCSQNGILDLVRRSCELRQSCRIDMRDVRTSDPCWGTYKYLQTNFICLPAIQGVTCEGSTAYLRCGRGRVIFVYGAYYGRRNSRTCSDGRPQSQVENVNCINPAQKVAERCNGRHRCSIEASNSVFGDPCYGTYKYLEVAYVCIYFVDAPEKKHMKKPIMFSSTKCI